MRVQEKRRAGGLLRLRTGLQTCSGSCIAILKRQRWQGNGPGSDPLRTSHQLVDHCLPHFIHPALPGR